jgi:hypothetical protein
MTTAQYTVQDKATLIRRIVDQLVSLKLIKDLNSEIELRSMNPGGNSSILYKGRPKGIALDKLDDQSFSLLAKVFSKNVQLNQSSEVQGSYFSVYADRKPILSVEARTGTVRSLNLPVRQSGQQQPASTQISPVQQEVFNRIIKSVEQTKASPVRNFITQLLKDIATAPQRGQQRRADERMAKTATALLNNFGRVENGQLVYQAAGYSIEKQADRTTVRDSSGSKVLQFTDSLVGSRIVASNVTNDIRYEFKAAKKQIAEGIALDPLERSRQLGRLAPQSEFLIAQEIGRLQAKQAASENAGWVVEAAIKLLERYGTATGKNTLAYENSELYSIQQDTKKNDLSIADKNGQVLLEMKGGQLTTLKLELQDIRNFGILQDYLMNNPVEIGSVLRDLEPQLQASEPRSQAPEPPPSEPEYQEQLSPKVSVSISEKQANISLGEKEVTVSQVVPNQSRSASVQPKQENPTVVSSHQSPQPQATGEAEQIYASAKYLLESYGSDLGSTARTYTAVTELVTPQPQQSTDRSQQPGQAASQNPQTRRVISAYNEALSTYEVNADRKAATDKIYSGVSLVSVSNVQDLDGGSSPELRKSERPTFYAIQDGEEYLVLPIPAMTSMQSKYMKGMFDVAGSASMIESLREPARFRADTQGNLHLVQKGSLITEGGKESDLPSRSNGTSAQNKVSSSEPATKVVMRSVEILRDYDRSTFSLSVTEPGETTRNVLQIDTKNGEIINKDIRPQDFQYLEELITQQSAQNREKGSQAEL